MYVCMYMRMYVCKYVCMYVLLLTFPDVPVRGWAHLIKFWCLASTHTRQGRRFCSDRGRQMNQRNRHTKYRQNQGADRLADWQSTDRLADKETDEGASPGKNRQANRVSIIFAPGAREWGERREKTGW